MEMKWDLINYSYQGGKEILEKRDKSYIKQHGQYLTPPNIARYMAKQLGDISNSARILEPAAGSGVLISGLIERLIYEKLSREIWIDAYEIDLELSEFLGQLLLLTSKKAEENNIKIHWNIYNEDFILSCIPNTQPSLFHSSKPKNQVYDLILSNPPYLKLNGEDKRVKASFGKINGHTNIYTLFMALSAKLLSQKGRACFIVPRSFCSGIYFAKFRRELIKEVNPLSVHIFHSREEVFKKEDVLQENVIFTFEKKAQSETHQYFAGLVNISESHNDTSLDDVKMYHQIPFGHFLNRRDKHFPFRLPTGILDESIIETIDKWDGFLESYGIEVSTGPVVPFRSLDALRENTSVEGTIPLLWMHNVKPFEIHWPLEKTNKHQAILDKKKDLLFLNTNCVLLRRFSAKEDRRRLISAPFLSENFPFSHIGFENHLNIIFRKRNPLSKEETLGLSAIINYPIIDRYFRIINGNTQINAGEIRNLPVPPLPIIKQIGEYILNSSEITPEKIDYIVFSVLMDNQLISEDFPLIQETRFTMGKIEQAQEILESIGLPSAQQNEISALTLLVLAHLSEDSLWNEASNINLRVHDILVEIKNNYGREYAENTRESIRRQVLHQFEQAGIVIRNPEDLSLATNSPKTHYALSDYVLSALRAYGTDNWENKRNAFIDQRGLLLDVYMANKEQNKVPLQISDGTIYKLSPGNHNKLQAAIISEFGPRFAPGARLLYLGDTARKILVFEKEIFLKLNISITDHGKLPDIVLYDELKNWIYLIEAVTSHGPVSPKRLFELKELFIGCSSDMIFVTAFFNVSTFKRFLNEIAWETEVWIAEIPSHLIHYNGDKFIGPHK